MNEKQPPQKKKRGKKVQDMKTFTIFATEHHQQTISDMSKKKGNSNYKRQNLEEDTVNIYNDNQVKEGTNYRRHDLEDDDLDTYDDDQDQEDTNYMYQNQQEEKDAAYDNEQTGEATNLSPQNRNAGQKTNYVDEATNLSPQNRNAGQKTNHVDEATNLNPQNRNAGQKTNYVDEATNLNPQNRNASQKTRYGNDDTNEATELNRQKGGEATEYNPQKGEEATEYNPQYEEEATEYNPQYEEEATERDNPEQGRETEYGPKHTEEPQPEKEYILNKRPESDAKLVWWGLSLTGRKNYILREGKNYIGRKDEDMPADLSLKDEYASARSICIEVEKIYPQRGEEYYEYTLTIVRAKNAVLVRGKEVPVGSTTKLNFNDTIVLGKTTLTLKKVKKWL